MNKIKVCLIYCLFLISRVSAGVYCISDNDLFINTSKGKTVGVLNYTPDVFPVNLFDAHQITKDAAYTYITGSWIENYSGGQNRYATLFYKKEIDLFYNAIEFKQLRLSENNSRAFAIESVPTPSTWGRATSTSIAKAYIGGKVVNGTNQESAKIWFFENQKEQPVKQIDLKVPPAPDLSVYISCVKSLILSGKILYAGGLYYQGPATVYDSGPYLWRIDSEKNEEIDGLIVDKYGEINSMVQVENYLYLAGYGYDYDTFGKSFLQVWKYDIKKNKVVSKLINSLNDAVKSLGNSQIIGITKDNNGNLFIAVKADTGNLIGNVNQDLSRWQLTYFSAVPSSIDCDNQYVYVSIDDNQSSSIYYQYKIRDFLQSPFVAAPPEGSTFQGAKDLYVDKITTSSIQK
jgi:hypothetical protein